MKSRRERKLEAKKNNMLFEPQYNSSNKINKDGKVIKLGGKPKTHEEMFGVGHERFNNKFVTIKEIEEE